VSRETLSIESAVTTIIISCKDYAHTVNMPPLEQSPQLLADTYYAI